MENNKKSVPGFVFFMLVVYTNTYLYNLYDEVYSEYSYSGLLYNQTYDPGGKDHDLAESKQLKFVLQPQTCSEKGVILVHSHSSDIALRGAQREAWDSTFLHNIGFRRIFVLFLSDQISLKTLKTEREKHDDILLVDLVESYYRLSYKHVIGLSWAVSNCDNLTELIKMDDDIHVDLPKFLQTASRNIPNNSDLWMLGLLQVDLNVERDPESKWYMPQDLYNPDHFPNFLSGWLYYTNVKTVETILTSVLKCNKTGILSSVTDRSWLEDTFWIDDVWLAGLVADELGVNRYSLNSYYTPYSEQLSCCLEKGFSCPFLVAPVDSKRAHLIVEAGARTRLCSKCDLQTRHSKVCRKYCQIISAHDFEKECRHKLSKPVVTVEIV